jgi:hypothetical protein
MPWEGSHANLCANPYSEVTVHPISISMALPSSEADSKSRHEHDALLRSHPYEPKDFDYYEDAERRWTGVAIYGAILVATAGLNSGPGYSVTGIETAGFVMAVTGLLVMIMIAGVLLVLLGGEAALAAVAAGLTLIFVGGSFAAGADTSWSSTLVALAVVGSCCVAIGAGAAFRCWRLLAPVAG